MKIFQYGFSLIETIITIAIITGVVSVFFMALRFSVSSSPDVMIAAQMQFIAKSFKEEIFSKQLINPEGGFTGPSTEQNRHAFDSLDDFNGFNSNSIRDISGAIIPELAGYSVSILISPVTLPNNIFAYEIRITINHISNNTLPFILTSYRIREA